MSDPLAPIVLFEDNHCLAVAKPAGLACQGDETGRPTLVDWAAADLKRRYDKPGNVYVGLVHRLDQPVSGVVLMARTSKAAARLSQQFREGTVAKVYWAIVEGRPESSDGEWIDYLVKNADRNVVRRVDPDHPDAREARLAYSVLEGGPRTSWLEIRPTTGRGHQIRVQLAERRLPIVGDHKYGATSTLIAADGGRRIALHARSLTFRHPTRAEAIEVRAPVPADWPGDGGGGPGSTGSSRRTGRPGS